MFFLCFFSFCVCFRFHQKKSVLLGISTKNSHKIPAGSIHSSRFNAAQYGSFLFPSTSAAAAAARFPGIPTPAQCSVKGDTAAAHHWAAAAATAGGRYDNWTDLHLAADYSAAAAAHYSNMTVAAGKGTQKKLLLFFLHLFFLQLFISTCKEIFF